MVSQHLILNAISCGFNSVYYQEEAHCNLNMDMSVVGAGAGLSLQSVVITSLSSEACEKCLNCLHHLFAV